MSNDEGMTKSAMTVVTLFDIRHSCFVILNVQISDV
jgi:hypothetical protein